MKRPILYLTCFCVVPLVWVLAKSEAGTPSPNVSIFKNDARLEDLAAELSRVAGRRVRAAEPVADRRVSLIVSDTPLPIVLDSVCEMTGLKWEERPDGDLLIHRAAPRRPHSRSELAPSLHAALPNELRTYLYLADFRSLSGPGRWEMALKAELRQQGLEMQAKLVREIRKKLASKPELAYSELSRDEREIIHYLMFFRGFTDFDAVLYDRESPHRIEPERAVLAVANQNIIMIQMYLAPDDPVGFGTGMLPP